MKTSDAIIKTIEVKDFNLKNCITLIKSDHFESRKQERNINFNTIVTYAEKGIKGMLKAFISNQCKRTYGIVKVNRLNIVVALERNRKSTNLDYVLITAKEQSNYRAKNINDAVIMVS